MRKALLELLLAPGTVQKSDYERKLERFAACLSLVNEIRRCATAQGSTLLAAAHTRIKQSIIVGTVAEIATEYVRIQTKIAEKRLRNADLVVVSTRGSGAAG